MKHWLLLPLLLVTSACTQPSEAPVKIFVGATLVQPGQGAVLAHSVVVVDAGIITAIGAQASVPIPTGSRKISGMGRFIYTLDPAHDVRQGDEANFGLYETNPAAGPAKLLGRMIGPRWEPLR